MVSVEDKAEMTVIFVTNNIHTNVFEIRPFHKLEAPIVVSRFHRFLALLELLAVEFLEPCGAIEHRRVQNAERFRSRGILVGTIKKILQTNCTSRPVLSSPLVTSCQGIIPSAALVYRSQHCSEAPWNNTRPSFVSSSGAELCSMEDISTLCPLKDAQYSETTGVNGDGVLALTTGWIWLNFTVR